MYCAQGRYMVARKEYPTLRHVCNLYIRVCRPLSGNSFVFLKRGRVIEGVVCESVKN